MTITNGYATLIQIKAYLGISDSNDDTLLERAVEAASRQIDGLCDRAFYDAGSATARVFAPACTYELDVDDFSTTTGLVIKTDDNDDGTFETTWTTADYELRPLSSVAGGVSGWPYQQIVSLGTRNFPTYTRRTGVVEVTARWGWAAVPKAIEDACLILATRLFKRKDSAEGVLGFGDFGAVRLSRTDPDVAALIGPYRKIAVG